MYLFERVLRGNGRSENMILNYGIIAIGYKNIKGMQRLLERLNDAEYHGEQVTLIISIDHSENSEVFEIAKGFCWQHGEKIVKNYKQRMGLRQHILRCGDYLDEYSLDASAVFEDDIYPADDFYLYMKAVTEKYSENEYIAGASLYTHCSNMNAKKDFYPIIEDGDNYFMQYAQSWGQVWFKKQWNAFKMWYQENNNEYQVLPEIPENVSNWNENSWLKYHIKYCIEQNKYFVYPYISHSTCFNEAGEHTAADNDLRQVVLSTRRSRHFQLIDFNENALKYDAFWENEGLYKYCGVEKRQLEVDLYGTKRSTKRRYLLTKKQLPYKIVKSWGNRLTPHDMNLIYDIPGHEIHLYDLGICHQQIELPKQPFEVDKFKQYFNVFDSWLTMQEQGRSIEEYFNRNNFRRIAIYGYGKMGKHLYRALSRTEIKVEYVIDENRNSGEEGVVVKNPNDELPSVDAIVVTPVFDFYKIWFELKNRCKAEIMSISDVFSVI